MAKSTTLILCVLIIIFSTTVNSVSFEKKLRLSNIIHKSCLTLGWPYVGIKTVIVDPLSLELRVAYCTGTTYGGLRGYYELAYNNRLRGGVLAEIGATGFTREKFSGNGGVVGMAVYGEYFVLNNIGVTLDFGPAYIDLTDKDGYRSSGLEWVINTGLSWYFR
ncbi:MAG: hypothetical protein WC955_05430 [Elusimicrobiota bacterium]